MKKTVIIYGSSTGTCEELAGRIGARLGVDDVIGVGDLDDSVIASNDNLILGTSTWGAGEMQDDWYDGVRTLRGADLSGKTVALFGCGGDRDKTKRPKMGKVAADIADFAIVTTDNPRTEKPADIIADILPGFDGSDTPYVVVEDRIEAIHWAMDHAEKDDVIVLCGKGHETYQEVNHVKHHMDEREIVADYLSAGK